MTDDGHIPEQTRAANGKKTDENGLFVYFWLIFLLIYSILNPEQSEEKERRGISSGKKGIQLKSALYR